MSTLRFSPLLFILVFALSLTLFAQTPQKEATATVAGVVTLKGEPARGVPVSVQMQNPSTPSNRNTPPRAKTDADGRFRITGIAAGQYIVGALAPGFVTEGSQQNFGLAGKTVNLSAGETVENLELTLTPGGVITGRITDSNGEPVAETNVRLTRVVERNPSGPPMPPPPPMNMAAYRTDDRGVYRIFGLAAGKYRVSVGLPARANGFVFQQTRSFIPETFHPDTTDEALAKVIEVEEGHEATDVDIKVAEAEKAYEVSGRVINAETGQPVPQAGLVFGSFDQSGRMSGSGFSSEWQTDANGQFQILGIRRGKYGVSLENREGKLDLYSDPVTIEIIDSDVAGVEVRAQRGASISGTVVIEGTSDPAILARRSQIMLNTSPAIVRMPRQASQPDQNSSPGLKSNTRVNADGSFRFSGMPPGRVNFNSYSNVPKLSLLRIEQNGAPLKDSTIEIHAGEQVAGIRVVFGYGDGSVRGQIKVIGGELPEGLRLLAGWRRTDNLPNAISNTTPLDTRGQFVAKDMVSGEYEFRILPIFSDLPPDQAATKILMRLSKPRQIVAVTNGSQAQVTITIDLSQEN